MQASLQGALEDFARHNATLAPRTEALLARTLPQPERHAALLNTLALLEHMGCSRILRTQAHPALDGPTLRHIAEEAHHAYFLKHQAEKLAGRSLAFAD